MPSHLPFFFLLCEFAKKKTFTLKLKTDIKFGGDCSCFIFVFSSDGGS